MLLYNLNFFGKHTKPHNFYYAASYLPSLQKLIYLCTRNHKSLCRCVLEAEKSLWDRRRQHSSQNQTTILAQSTWREGGGTRHTTEKSNQRQMNFFGALRPQPKPGQPESFACAGVRRSSLLFICSCSGASDVKNEKISFRLRSLV